MAGVILVPQDHAKTETTATSSAPSEIFQSAPEPGLRSSDESTSNNSWESDSQSSSCDFEGLHAALEDRQDGSTPVRRLELSQIADKPSLFQELAELLMFDHPRVQSECGRLIARIIPQLEVGAELDKCMSIVLPRLVHNLGHTESDVRVSAAHSLVTFLQLMEDEKPVMQALVEQGLLHSNPTVQQTIIANLGLLFTSELADKNWQDVMLYLVSAVVRQQGPQAESVAALQSLRNLIGDDRFQSYLQQMNVDEKQDDSDSRRRAATKGQQSPISFGFVDRGVIEMLCERDNWKARVHGIEELKLAVKSASDQTVLLSELPSFLKFLSELSADVNFKVVLVTLEIYGVLIDKLKWQISPHLDSVVDALVRLFSENKIVVRSQAAKVLHSLMHCAGPSSVVTLLCHHLVTPGTGKQTSSKTREEILNAVILALLTFPSYDFNLVAICTAVAPVLFDAKCRVRQSALECLAVLAQAMGSSKLAAVAKAIDDAAYKNPSYDTEAALSAVLARLARRQLPRITPDGQVEYSVRVPSGSGSLGRSSWAGHGISSFPRGADIDWILAGSGSLGSGSPHSRNSSTAFAITEISDGPNSRNKFQSASFPSSPAAPRRIVSPGHHKNSLPWNEAGSTVQRKSSSNYSDSVHTGLSVESQQLQQIDQATEDDGRLPQVSSAGWRPRPNSQELPISGTSRSSSRNGSGSKGGLHRTAFSTDSLALKPLSGHSQPLTSSLRSGIGSTSHGMIYSVKQPTGDRSSYRPLDKVAAMLGSNILPNKLRPVVGESHHDLVGSTIVPLPSSFNPSSTWPGPTSGGSLPALPQKRKVLGPITDFRNAPIPTRPTLLRSSSGSKRSRVPPIGPVTLNGSPAAVRPEDCRTTRGLPLQSHPSVSEQHGEFEPKPPQGPSHNRYATAPSSALKSPSKDESQRGFPENKSRDRSSPRPSSRFNKVIRSRCPLDSDDDDDNRSERDDDGRAGGSVDSGVESLARPQSRSSLAPVPRRRPRSLDFHSTYSLYRSDSETREEIRAGGDGQVSPSSSGRQSRLWYDGNEDDDDIEEEGNYGRGRTGDSGVRKRAVSEVSSLTSSLEQLPDSESPPFRTLSPAPLVSAPLEHLRWETDGQDNGSEVDRTTVLSASRVHSTVSWEHELPAQTPDISRKKSGTVQELLSRDEDGIKCKDDFLAASPYSNKPVLVHSLSLQRLKQVSPICSQTTDVGVAAPFVNGLTSATNTSTATSISRRNISPIRGPVFAPRIHTDRVLLSSSRDVSSKNDEDISVDGKGVPQRPHRPSDASSIYAVSPPRVSSPPIPTHRNSRVEQDEDGEGNHRSASRSSYLPSIEGRSVSHMMRDPSVDGGSFSLEEEDPNAMSLSQSTLSKMMNRRMEMMKEAERRKQDKQQRSQELKKVSVHGHERGLRPRTPPGKPAASRRRPRHIGATVQNSTTVMQNPKNTSSTARSTDSNDRLLKHPDEAVKTALNKLQSDEWAVKCEGIKIIGAVCTSHPAAVISELHRINLGLLAEVKNLRSTVSRSAIQAFASLFSSAKKNMESDLEAICHVLLHKSGETNVFIKEDVEKTLTQMVENVSPQKAALALILGGATHRNAAVRKTTAQFLSLACEKLGPNRVLSGTKDVTDRIIPTTAQFLMDGSPLTRYYGRKIFFMLLPNNDFDRILKQYTQPSTIRNIQDILEGLKTKGLGTMPNESAASRHLKGLK